MTDCYGTINLRKVNEIEGENWIRKLDLVNQPSE